MKQETIQQCVALKAQGHKVLYFAEIRGLEFIFRPLTFSEYKVVLELEDFTTPVVANDMLIRFALLYPHAEPWLEHGMAGDVDQLAQVILDLSGFQNEEVFKSMIALKREEVQQLESLVQIYICTAFRSYKPEDIEAMTLEEQLELLCKAEEVLGQPVDFGAIFGGGEQPKAPIPPVPPGFETTAPEMMEPSMADLPDWDKIMKGDTTY